MIGRARTGGGRQGQEKPGRMGDVGKVGKSIFCESKQVQGPNPDVQIQSNIRQKRHQTADNAPQTVDNSQQTAENRLQKTKDRE
jgi:hypothetical protein